MVACHQQPSQPEAHMHNCHTVLQTHTVMLCCCFAPQAKPHMAKSQVWAWCGCRGSGLASCSIQPNTSSVQCSSHTLASNCQLQMQVAAQPRNFLVPRINSRGGLSTDWQSRQPLLCTADNIPSHCDHRACADGSSWWQWQRCGRLKPSCTTPRTCLIKTTRSRLCSAAHNQQKQPAACNSVLPTLLSCPAGSGHRNRQVQI